jgi:hypothetical protein
MNVSQIKKIPASSTTKIVNTIFLLQTTPTHKEQEDIFSVCVSYKLTLFFLIGWGKFAGHTIRKYVLFFLIGWGKFVGHTDRKYVLFFLIGWGKFAGHTDRKYVLFFLIDECFSNKKNTSFFYH